MTRVAGWLYFGAVQRSNAFTAVESASEECKIFAEGSCPFYMSGRAPCSCEWDFLMPANCTNYNATESRALQKIFWALQSQDSDADTGRRTASPSYLLDGVGSTPATTQWWGNTSILPGSEKGQQAAGYATSYDRLRVASALAIVKLPIYNYAHSLGLTNRIDGVYMGLEEDGLFTGFNGCKHTHADFAFWQSADYNYAAAINPELCPLGKYGYDPRCRAWYAIGQTQYLSQKDPVHISAPYRFSLEDGVATHASKWLP